MTLVWTQLGAPAPPGPRTHAFVLGVGHYRHMPDGEDPVPKRIFTLKQVSNPPLSAAAVVDYLTTEYDHPVAPLGSVEVLVSQCDGPASIAGQPVAGATLAAVKAAFLEWKRRCDEHPDNVAIFYFCGHGVSADNHYLLLEDFAAHDERPMENSVDLDMFHKGMRRCRAQTQLFLVDACRETPWDLTKRHGSRGDPLIDPDPTAPGGRDAPILRATGENRRAFGARNSVTNFTKALLAGLRGAAATQEPPSSGQWVVRYLRLASQISQLLHAAEGPPQESRIGGEAGDALVVRLTRPPRVALNVALDPDTTAKFAELQLDPADGAAPFRGAPKHDGCWAIEVPAALYLLSAQFSQPGLIAVPFQFEAVPPRWPVRLRVQT